jgi:hypothetical protein
MAILLNRELPTTTGQLVSSIGEIYGCDVSIRQKDVRDDELFSSFGLPNFLQAEDATVDLSFSLALFPPEYFKSLGIDTIKIASYLKRRPNKQFSKKDHLVSGVMDNVANRIYTVTDGLTEVIPHEIGHRILSRMPKTDFRKLKKNWLAVNQRYGLVYSGFDMAFEQTFDRSTTEGFVSSYSEADFSEDLPEVLSKLVSEPNLTMVLASQQPAIQKKIELVFQMLDKATEGMMGKTWRNSIRNGRISPFVSFWENRPEKIEQRFLYSLAEFS